MFFLFVFELMSVTSSFEIFSETNLEAIVAEQV